MIQQGYNAVRRSPLLLWMSLAAVLFAILFYALVFPFFQAVTDQFATEDELAGFLGTFQGISNAATILLSLFVANRLYARFGFMAAILVYPIIYLVGFAVLAVQTSFPTLVVLRFAQILWAGGVVQGANQAMFNVVPPDRREQTRTFIQGIANQVGISLAGVMLLPGERLLQQCTLFIIGGVAAAVTIYFVWRARQAYGQALFAALRTGQSHLFFSEDQPFGGFCQDAAAVAAVIAGLNHPDVAVRRVSAEILGKLSSVEATDAIVKNLDDPDPTVQAALLKALVRAGASSALLEVAFRLASPEAEVRLQAVRTVYQLTAYANGIKRYLRPLLDDPVTAVRCAAAVGLLKVGDDPEAEDMLKMMATISGITAEAISDRITAMEALAELGSQTAYDIAVIGLSDSQPRIRRAAAMMFAHIDDEQCLDPLLNALGDEDALALDSIATALGYLGLPALKPTIASLQEPTKERGGLLALQKLPVHRAATAVQAYAKRKISQAVHYHTLWQKSKRAAISHDRWQLLTDSLRDQSRHHGKMALQAVGLLRNREAMTLSIANLDSHDLVQRANALETIESLNNGNLVRPLLVLWDADAEELPDVDADLSPSWLTAALQDSESWIRATAALAAKGINSPQIRGELEQLTQSDPDSLVRETAQFSLNGASAMDTLSTLSVMERILFLRGVSLFAQLRPGDLKQIATMATENLFSDNSVLAQQGEPVDVLHIIVSGTVRVTVTAADGLAREVGQRGPGDYIGELAIIMHEERVATFTAVGDVRTLYIFQDQFEELLRTRPEASMAVMRVLCQRLKNFMADTVNTTYYRED